MAQEPNFVNSQENFQANTQGYNQDSWRQIQENQGRNYYGNNNYGRPGDPSANDSNSARMEDIMKKLDSTKLGIKEISKELSSLIQLVYSHSTSIKKLEHHMRQVPTTLN
ncbi:hypothetical protein HAX54_046820 [Datura stramonium]|uniref:Uncharacterized protein n=1 Tax=Datura stramonium TaxID=4076 RepID=A0ABS8SS60_DATST|nr:hypothetical protein [Datura stramonium]